MTDDTKAKEVLRGLAQDLKEKDSDLRNFATGRLAQFINTANENLEKVSKGNSLAFDAKIFRDAAELAHAQIKVLAGNEERTIPQFLQALKAKYVRSGDSDRMGRENPNAFEWDSFARDVATMFRPAVGLNCLYGPLDVQPKARKAPAVRQRRGDVAPLERPAEVCETASSKEATDQLIDTMWRILYECKTVGCPVVELIMNKKSFAQTIENLFALSFLVRDGRAALWTDAETEMMMVRHIVQQKGTAAVAEQQQFVVDISQNDWQLMRSHVQVPRMPARDEPDEEEPAIAVASSRQQRQSGHKRLRA